MQQQNIKEYKLIRDELLQLKDCITTYIGFVIGGSGAAFLGIAAILKTSPGDNLIGILSYLLSYVISLVCFILFYKFNSHNRYAGYCKLLTQERLVFPTATKRESQFISWELCMDAIRKSSHYKRFLQKYGKDVAIPEVEGNIVVRIKKLRYKGNILKKSCKGFGFIISTLFGKSETRSWRFPLYVVNVFFSLNLIFDTIGTYYILKYPVEFIPMNYLLSFVFAFLILHIFIWIKKFAKLFDFVAGELTVDAYCWKFLPIRYMFIKNQNKRIKYHLILF